MLLFLKLFQHNVCSSSWQTIIKLISYIHNCMGISDYVDYVATVWAIHVVVVELHFMSCEGVQRDCT